MMPTSEDKVADRFERELRALMDRFGVDASVVSYHFHKSEYTNVLLSTKKGIIEDPGYVLHELLEYAHDSVLKRYPESCTHDPPKFDRVH